MMVRLSYQVLWIPAQCGKSFFCLLIPGSIADKIVGHIHSTYTSIQSLLIKINLTKFLIASTSLSLKQHVFTDILSYCLIIFMFLSLTLIKKIFLHIFLCFHLKREGKISISITAIFYKTFYSHTFLLGRKNLARFCLTDTSFQV
jgi:hypothetical protein